MSTLTDREKWDIQKVSENENHYPSLPERRRTAAVSLAAVSACGHHLEYVPETVLDKEICRAALNSKDADCGCLRIFYCVFGAERKVVLSESKLFYLYID